MTTVTAPVAETSDVRTPWTEFWRKFKRQHAAVIAGVFVALLVLTAIAAPFIVPYDAENFFDYDSPTTGRRSSTCSASIRSGATSSAASSW
jgi:glutathione transport system permease protein